jgi:hypothetical protein
VDRFLGGGGPGRQPPAFARNPGLLCKPVNPAGISALNLNRPEVEAAMCSSVNVLEANRFKGADSDASAPLTTNKRGTALCERSVRYVPPCRLGEGNLLCLRGLEPRALVAGRQMVDRCRARVIGAAWLGHNASESSYRSSRAFFFTLWLS